jgi:aminoglycoside phosphotransferase (APT) family kinase protein
MFKDDWEKADAFATLSEAEARAMAAMADVAYRAHEVIAGGCANLNARLFPDKGPPLILRVYLRDSAAASRERNLAERLQGMVPVPRVLNTGVYGERSFAVVECAEGVTLRDLLLGRAGIADTAPVLREVGRLLGGLRRVTFDSPGFFDAELRVRPDLAPDFVALAQDYAAHPSVVAALGESVLQRLARLFAEHRADLPGAEQPSLVHGDYDPANILVAKQDGGWRVSAVLDWEFAFSGSFLWDVGNMLRYAHRLPGAYGEGFIAGIEETGLALPGNWRRSIALTNMLSLLHMLRAAEPAKRPRARRDMAELIGHFMAELEPPGRVAASGY